MELAISHAIRVVFPHRQILQNAVKEFLYLKCDLLKVIYKVHEKEMMMCICRSQNQSSVTYFIPEEPKENKWMNNIVINDNFLKKQQLFIHMNIDDIFDKIEQDTANMTELVSLKWRILNYNHTYNIQGKEPARIILIDDISTYLQQEYPTEYKNESNTLVIYFKNDMNTNVINLRRRDQIDIVEYMYNNYLEMIHINDIMPRILKDVGQINHINYLSWHVDLIKEYKTNYVAIEKTAGFWYHAQEEFIQKTWSPKRHILWCLSYDEQKELCPERLHD